MKYFLNSEGPSASIGRCVSANPYRVNTITAGQKQDVSGTVLGATVGAVNETQYELSFYVAGQTLTASYLSDANATDAEVTDGLIAAIEGNAILSAFILSVNRLSDDEFEVYFLEGVTASATASGTGLSINTILTEQGWLVFQPGRFCNLIDGKNVQHLSGTSNACPVLVLDQQEGPGAGILVALPSGPTDGGATYAVEHPGAAITFGSPVYIESTVGADRGRPYTASSGSRQQLADAIWVGVDPNDANIAHIKF